MTLILQMWCTQGSNRIWCPLAEMHHPHRCSDKTTHHLFPCHHPCARGRVCSKLVMSARAWVLPPSLSPAQPETEREGRHLPGSTRAPHSGGRAACQVCVLSFNSVSFLEQPFPWALEYRYWEGVYQTRHWSSFLPINSYSRAGHTSTIAMLPPCPLASAAHTLLRGGSYLAYSIWPQWLYDVLN